MIKDRIREDMKAAMREHAATRLSTIRLLLAAVKQREIDDQVEADDALVMEVITKMVKQRRDAVEQYRNGGRDDLAQKEADEIDVLAAYLPQPLTDAQLDAVIEEAVASVPSATMAQMGAVMALVKAKVAGRADMSKVSQRVRAKLSA